jgi:hypothetical protein
VCLLGYGVISVTGILSEMENRSLSLRWQVGERF